MNNTARSHMRSAVIASLLTIVASPAALAQDFFSALFGGMGAQQQQQQRGQRQAPPMMSLPFATEGETQAPIMRRAPPRPSYASSGQAYCVRTCDGRYFPISGSDKQSRAETCNSFCPASPTKVYYGSTIENAADGGKRYSDLPNAYKFREQVVDNCTCNGKDHFGLAKIDIKDDQTVRKGDIIVEADDMKVANRNASDGETLRLSRASASIRNKYDTTPVVASE